MATIHSMRSKLDPFTIKDVSQTISETCRGFVDWMVTTLSSKFSDFVGYIMDT